MKWLKQHILKKNKTIFGYIGFWIKCSGKVVQSLTITAIPQVERDGMQGLYIVIKMRPIQYITYYYGLLAHFQNMVWMPLGDECPLNRTDWGWEVTTNMFITNRY